MTFQPELFNIPSPDKSYEAILADPPWKFAAGGTKATTNQYNCMKLHQIAALPVHKIAAQDSLLFMWATAPMLPHALEVVRAWSFEYISCAAWAKQSKLGNGWAFGTGYWFRSTAEFLILAKRGKPKITHKRNIRNLIVAPVREHSRKPDCTYEMIEKMRPNANKIELFARQNRQGWDCWGNQTDKFTEDKK